MEKVDEICSKLGFDQFGEVPAVKKVSEVTKLKHQYIILGLVVLLLLLALSSPGMWFLYTLTTFVWPAYNSYKAVETPGKTDDKHWLTYWVVFGFVSTFSETIDFVLSFIPLFGYIKVAALVYLHISKEKGSKFLYDNAIKKVFLLIQEKAGFVFEMVDQCVEDVASKSLKKEKAE